MAPLTELNKTHVPSKQVGENKLLIDCKQKLASRPESDARKDPLVPSLQHLSGGAANGPDCSMLSSECTPDSASDESYWSIWGYSALEAGTSSS